MELMTGEFQGAGARTRRRDIVRASSGSPTFSFDDTLPLLLLKVGLLCEDC